MAEYKYVKLEIDNRGVAYVTLNRPDIHNAFDDVLIGELTKLFDGLDKDSNVRVVVIGGEGKSFCAGGDLNWMRSMKGYSRDENMIDSDKLAEMYHTINSLSKPLIGAVHGAALGGGSGLAAVCDYVVACDDAKFGFTETRLGILPAVIGPYALQKIGISNARAYFTSGMMFSAHTAKDIGLVHKVVPTTSFAEAREETIREFLKAGPTATGKAKKLINDILHCGTNKNAVRAATIEAIADARISDEGQEGMDALLTKRKASWVA